MIGPNRVVPLRFDLSDLVRRSVASLYSHLVTRPTGQALRIGIESQIAELGAICVSILDFTQVIVLDYSCADETVAKLLMRYQQPDRPAEAYFIARGVADRHRHALEAVLERHGLALAAEVCDVGPVLLGVASPLERKAWAALETLVHAEAEEVAGALGASSREAGHVLDRLVERRLAVKQEYSGVYSALAGLVGSS